MLEARPSLLPLPLALRSQAGQCVIVGTSEVTSAQRHPNRRTSPTQGLYNIIEFLQTLLAPPLALLVPFTLCGFFMSSLYSYVEHP